MNVLIFDITNVDFRKYDDMLLNPLRFDHNPTSKAYNNITSSDNIHKCLSKSRTVPA